MSDKGAKYLVIRQVKSGIGKVKSQNATLVSLGLGKVNRSSKLLDNPSMRGMIRKVSHLVEVHYE